MGQGADASASSAGLLCQDQWAWKPDAPEFIPGGMAGAGKNTLQHTQQLWQQQQQQQQQQYETQLREKSNQLEELTRRMLQMEIENAQTRASWEKERRRHFEYLGKLRNLMNLHCGPREDATRNGSRHNVRAPALQRPLFTPSAPTQNGGAESVLDLNDDCEALCLVGALPEHPGPDWCSGLEEQNSCNIAKGCAPLLDAGGPGSKMGLLDLLEDGSEQHDTGSRDVPSAKELASTLQTMFPHLKVKTGNSPKVGRHSSSSGMQSVSIADKPLARTTSVEEPLARTVSVTSKKSWADEPLARTVSLDEPLARTVSVQSHGSKLSWADIADDDNSD